MSEWCAYAPRTFVRVLKVARTGAIVATDEALARTRLFPRRLQSRWGFAATYYLSMPKRGDPEKIYQAQRAGVFMRLVSEKRLDELDAEHWITRWEREAEATGRQRGSTGYWDETWLWIAGEGEAIEREPGPK